MMIRWGLATLFIIFTALMDDYSKSDAVIQRPQSSNLLLTFLNIMSGTFSNAGQVQLDFADRYHEKPHDQLDLVFKPVYVPATAPAATIYFEEVDNGRVFRRELLVITEENERHIHITHYNITDNRGPYDLNDLQKLKPEDLQTRPECESVFTSIENNVFFGTWVDCKNYIAPGKPGGDDDVWTCEGVSGIVWQNSEEADNKLPYQIPKTERFKLLPYMTQGLDVSSYVNPCDKTEVPLTTLV